MYYAVSLVRIKLQQQIQQMSAANEVLRSRNETLSADVARLNEAVQHVSVFASLLVSLKYKFACFFGMC